MRIGICGFGFVGKAINSFFQKDCTDIVPDIVIYDKYKEMNNFNILADTDLLYICIPTPYDVCIQSYDMTEMDNTLLLLAQIEYKGIILIKSTILPEYCEQINATYDQLKIIHNPEFLSAATAANDFANQSHIILGYTVQSREVIPMIELFYKKLFPLALISITTSNVAAITKLACNSFYATKVQFFTEIFLLCNKVDVDFNEVKKLMLNNKWINTMHTSVPGSDGQISFGGACLPKDINALNQFMLEKKTENHLLDAVIKERNSMRFD